MKRKQMAIAAALVMLAGWTLADPSSNSVAIQVATNESLDFRFIDHYVAPGRLSLGENLLHVPNLPRPGLHGVSYYRCRTFGLESEIEFYGNMVLVRITIPGQHRTALQSELSKRYGSPSKIAEGYSSWDVYVGGELRQITLHTNAVIERTINGKKQPIPDQALLDIARMKSEKEKRESSKPNESVSDEIEITIAPQQTNAPYSQPASPVEKR
jgi:hypothetical protein